MHKLTIEANKRIWYVLKIFFPEQHFKNLLQSYLILIIYIFFLLQIGKNLPVWQAVHPIQLLVYRHQHLIHKATTLLHTQLLLQNPLCSRCSQSSQARVVLVLARITINSKTHVTWRGITVLQYIQNQPPTSALPLILQSQKIMGKWLKNGCFSWDYLLSCLTFLWMNRNIV